MKKVIAIILMLALMVSGIGMTEFISHAETNGFVEISGVNISSYFDIQATDIETGESVDILPHSTDLTIMIAGRPSLCFNTKKALETAQSFIKYDPAYASEVSFIGMNIDPEYSPDQVKQYLDSASLTQFPVIDVSSDPAIQKMYFEVEGEVTESSYTLPLIWITDKNGNLLKVSTGYVTDQVLYEAINSSYKTLTGKTLPDPSSGTGGGTSPNEDATTKITLPLKVTYDQASARRIPDMINEFRTGSDAWYWNETDTEKIQKPGLSPMTYDYQLEKVAMLRAAEIAFYYSHTRPDGTNWTTAYNEFAGNFGGSKGENIALGYETAEAVHFAWREDDDKYAGQGHRRNLLNSSLTTVGIGHAIVNGVHCWVEDFGRRVVDTNPTTAETGDRFVEVSAKTEFISQYDFIYDQEKTQLSCGGTLDLDSILVGVQSTGSYASLVPLDISIDWTSAGKCISLDGAVLTAQTAGEYTLTGSFLGGKTQKISGSVHHVEKTDPGVEATYFSEGLTEGSHCSICHSVIREQTAIPKKKLENTRIRRLSNTAGGTVTIGVGDVDDASGYQIQYALNSAYTKGVKEKTISGLQCRIKRLRKKKTYYFRVRAYVKKGNRIAYSGWTGIKRIKIKK